MTISTVDVIATAISLFVGFLAAISYHYQVVPPPVIHNHLNMDLAKQYRALNKSCFILGASGATGKALIKEIVRLKPFERVVLIGRRKLEYEDEELKKIEQRVINFDEIEKHAEDFKGFDVGYSCLGALRGRDGADGFVKIEYNYVVGAAKLAKAGGTEHFHVVSSMGVNENSYFLYPSTKGRTDREVSEMGFNRASIYRPAFLIAERQSRMTDTVLKCVLKPVAWLAPTLMTTPIEVLAKAMLANTMQEQSPGPEIIDNKRIHSLAKALPDGK